MMKGKKITLGNMEIALYATHNLFAYDECNGQDENNNSIV